MSARVTIKQTDLKNAAKVAREFGVDIRFAPDGTVHVTASSATDGVATYLETDKADEELTP